MSMRVMVSMHHSCTCIRGVLHMHSFDPRLICETASLTHWTTCTSKNCCQLQDQWL